VVVLLLFWVGKMSFWMVLVGEMYLVEIWAEKRM